MKEYRISDEQIAEYYQPLFDFMANEHNLILTISQMNDILNVVDEVDVKLTALYDKKLNHDT